MCRPSVSVVSLHGDDTVLFQVYRPSVCVVSLHGDDTVLFQVYRPSICVVSLYGNDTDQVFLDNPMLCGQKQGSLNAAKVAVKSPCSIRLPDANIEFECHVYDIHNKAHLWYMITLA